MKNKVCTTFHKNRDQKKIELMESKPTNIKKLTALQEAYAALINCENKKNINLIKSLQEEVTLLQNQKSTSKKRHERLANIHP
jgi:hypothetical protein